MNFFEMHDTQKNALDISRLLQFLKLLPIKKALNIQFISSISIIMLA